MSTLQVLSTITLNLLRPNSNIIVYAKQYDGFSRLINASLIAGDSVWDVPNGVTAMVRYAKPDGTVGFYDMLEDQTTPAVTKLGTGLIQIALAQQALTAAGNVMVDVNFFAQDESRLTTLSFVISVEKGSPSDETMMSSDYFNILDRKINAVIAATTHPPDIAPFPPHNWMLWSEDIGSYVMTDYPSVGEKGEKGDDGTITVASNVRYQEGSSPTTIPTGSWVASPPTVRPGYYLWQRQILTFGDGTTSTSYLVARQGVDGSGAVDSVNGQTGAVTLDADDVGAVPYTVFLPENTDLNTVLTSGFYRLATAQTNAPQGSAYSQMIVSRGSDTVSQTIYAFNTAMVWVRVGYGIGTSTETWTNWQNLNNLVTSVNGQTGAVMLDADDVGAMPDSYVAPVQSVNGSTGAVTLSASDVGAATIRTGTTVPTTSDISSGEFYLKLES